MLQRLQLNPDSIAKFCAKRGRIQFLERYLWVKNVPKSEMSINCYQSYKNKIEEI